MKILYTYFLAVFFVSCNSSGTHEEAVKAVAIAGNEKLNLEDFKRSFISGGTIKDSTYLAKQLIERWAAESLFYQEAVEKLNQEELNIDKQVEEYKKSLVNYVYQTKLVEANLDTLVTREEVENYYDEHRNNFILRENIVKVNYLKIPVKAKDLDKIKRLLYAINPKDQALLKTLCIQNAENFFMNDSTWLLLDDVKKEIPKLRDEPDFNLSTGRVVEFSDDEYYYYLKVKDMKVKNGLSPINFERRNIRNFIVNTRKIQLIREYKQLLLEKAVANKSFVKY